MTPGLPLLELVDPIALAALPVAPAVPRRALRRRRTHRAAAATPPAATADAALPLDIIGC